MTLARADGVLEGRLNKDGTACFWIGAGAGRQQLIWPDGYFAGGASLTVFDKAGTKLASVGQRVTLAGGLASDGVGTPLGCDPALQAWIVGSVIEAK